MKSFKELLESNTWKDPKIGWWLSKPKTVFYHASHIDNVDSILENGLNAPKSGSTDGWVSLALSPYTAFGYASMSGGETTFRSGGYQSKHVPPNQRAVFIIEIPQKYFITKMADRRGNIDIYKEKLNNEELYKQWKGSDSAYYDLTEIRLPNHVPSKFIKGWMIKTK